MTQDLLDSRHIRDQLRVMKGAHSVDERPVIEALVEIAMSLYDGRYRGKEPGRVDASRGDLDIMDEVLGVVDPFRDAFVERFDLPAAYVTAASRHRPHVRRRPSSRRLWLGRSRRVIAAGRHHVRRGRRTGTTARFLTWKPVDRLWTAPLVEPSSAWGFWMGRRYNLSWTRQLRYESPSRASRVVVDSLATADEIIGQRSFEQLALQLEDGGISRIDFSWRCVIEAECSVLRAERDGDSFPCSLGTESSVWLTSPVPISVASME